MSSDFEEENVSQRVRSKETPTNYADYISSLAAQLKKNKTTQWTSGIGQLYPNPPKQAKIQPEIIQLEKETISPGWTENIDITNKNSPSPKRKVSAGFNSNFNEHSAREVFPKNTRTKEIENENVSSSTKPENKLMFKTAKEELIIQSKKLGKHSEHVSTTTAQKSYSKSAQSLFSYGNAQKRSLGARRGVQNKFIPPNQGAEQYEDNSYNFENEDEFVDERLKNIDPKMVELIRSEIMDSGSLIGWDDIAGLDFAKTTIQEIVIWPLLRPDIFTGLKRPPKGILLFGPPGTGKTLIGKCIASQSQSTFFSISASSLTSKWIGDGEKMVRALFAVARCHQPAVIFIDEIDSLLSQRSDTEHESSRRIKTEFLVQLDGATTSEDDRILVIGATNRPQELDEAARRRLVKRLYIPLPDQKARKQIVERLMSTEKNNLTAENIEEISALSGGYSGADMKNLCAEAALGPIRAIDFSMIAKIQPNEVRPITIDDFKFALNRVRASVSSRDLEQYVDWDNTYGSGVY